MTSATAGCITQLLKVDVDQRDIILMPQCVLPIGNLSIGYRIPVTARREFDATGSCENSKDGITTVSYW